MDDEDVGVVRTLGTIEIVMGVICGKVLLIWFLG